MEMKLTYLASPYSHESPAVRHERFEAAIKTAALLMSRGVLVYSPIAHTHAMSVAHDLPTDWKFWEQHCRAFLAASERMVILKLDGWDRSIGIRAETEIAIEMGIPIAIMEYKR